jgi:hypothetical protein
MERKAEMDWLKLLLAVVATVTPIVVFLYRVRSARQQPILTIEGLPWESPISPGIRSRSSEDCPKTTNKRDATALDARYVIYEPSIFLAQKSPWPGRSVSTATTC